MTCDRLYCCPRNINDSIVSMYLALMNIHKLQVEHLSNLSYALYKNKPFPLCSLICNGKIMFFFFVTGTKQSCQRRFDIDTNGFQWEDTIKFNEPNVELYMFNGGTERLLANEILHPRDIILEFFIKFMTAHQCVAMRTDFIQQCTS